jgi:crotonobetainyl-CoA:carnitine CoA-transferase CaiB-like acyl-CoA transferase
MAQPLAGVPVLDLSIWRPGPYATSLLCALGADVLKVEPPGGDPMRHYRQLFDAVNAGKRSIVLDLKEEGDRARALELATEARVVVEGFRPGVMARLGLDQASVRAVNPNVVYCSVSGYGQEGPLAELPGHDVNYQAWAGALSPEGAPAVMPPLPIADLASGMAAAFGICAALFGGEGAHLDIAMTDVMATWTGDAVVESSGAGGPVPGYGIFSTADDRQIALGVVNEQHFWSALCDALGLTELSGVDFTERMARGGELQEAVTKAVSIRRRDDLVTSLLAANVPVSPVLDRAGMVSNGPFRPFPIRWGDTGPSGAVPAVNQHRGQGFLSGA